MERVDQWFRVLVLSAGIGIAMACGTNGEEKVATDPEDPTPQPTPDTGGNFDLTNTRRGTFPTPTPASSCPPADTYDSELCESSTMCVYDGVTCCWLSWDLDDPEDFAYRSHCNMCSSDLECGTLHMPADLDCRDAS